MVTTTLSTNGENIVKTPTPLPTEALPTDASGCSFANGYLQEIAAPKYKPICYPGFQMTEKIKQASFFLNFSKINITSGFY